MTSEPLLHMVAATIATYAIHSTLLLLCAWGLDRFLVRHAAVRERLWKWGAMVPLLSTVCVLCWTSATPVWEWRLADVNVAPLMAEDARELMETPIAAESSRVPPMEPRFPAAFDSFELQPVDDAATASLDSQREPNATDGHWSMQIVPVQELLDRDIASSVPHDSGIATIGRSTEDMTSESVAACIDGVERRKADGGDDFGLAITGLIPSPPDSIEVSFLCVAIVATAASLALVGLMRLLLTSIAIRRLVKRGHVLGSGRSVELLSQLLTDRRVTRKVRLLCGDSFSEPAATGILHWTIVLPNGLSSELTDAELSALLCHELGHHVRRDIVWLLIGRMLTAAMPWQFLNRIAICKWQQAAEMECDEWTASSSIQPIILAGLLARVAEWKTDSSLQIGLSATAPPLSRRIEALLNRSTESKPRSQLQRIAMTIAMGSALLGISIFGPRLTWASTMPGSEAGLPREFDSLASPNQDEQMAALRSEFRALSSDLKLALELLADVESDPLIEETVQRITNQLEQIENNIHQKGFEQ